MRSRGRVQFTEGECLAFPNTERGGVILPEFGPQRDPKGCYGAD